MTPRQRKASVRVTRSSALNPFRQCRFRRSSSSWWFIPGKRSSISISSGLSATCAAPVCRRPPECPAADSARQGPFAGLHPRAIQAQGPRPGARVMTTSTPSARYKRCPKCQAMLRAVAEFCPHCGLSIPGNFPHKPLLAKDTLRIVSELREKIVPHRPTRAQAGARYVVLVACDRRDHLEYFRQKFATEVGIEVCYERRLGERRRRTAVSPGELRGGARRTRPPLDAELRRFGFAIVRTG